MRADFERIKKMLLDYESNTDGKMKGDSDGFEEIARELLTSWLAMTEREYQTDNNLHLVMLTKKLLNHE